MRWVFVFLVVISSVLVLVPAEKVYFITGDSKLILDNFTTLIQDTTHFIVKYYVNSTQNSISDANCTIQIQGFQKNNMNYVEGETSYYYSYVFNEVGFKHYNVTCNKTGHDFIQGQAFFNIVNAKLNSTVTSIDGFKPSILKETLITSTYLNVNNQPIENSDCYFNQSILMGFNGTHHNYSFYPNAGTLNYNISCYSSDYSNITSNYSVEIADKYALFEEINISLTGVSSCSNLMYDIDGDNKTEYVYTGYTGSSQLSKAFEYDFENTNFTIDSEILTENLQDGSIGYFYDNNNLYLIGCGFNTSYITFIKSESNTSIINDLRYCSVDLFDYNNDGKIDFIISGSDEFSTKHTLFYENTDDGFVNIKNFTGLEYSSVAHSDIDSDGYDDFIISGYDGANTKTIMYLSTENYDTPHYDFVNISQGNIIFFDFNNDGQTDLLIGGNLNNAQYGTGQLTLYQNNNANLTLNKTWADFFYGGMTIGDYDNNGWVDFRLVGTNPSFTPEGTIYYNFNGTFERLMDQNPLFWGSSLTNFDFDSDGDLDYAICGYENATSSKNKIYRNMMSEYLQNNAPTRPSINVFYNDDGLFIEWNDSTDDITPSLGLYYNLEIYDAISQEIVVKNAISSNPQSGFLGNMMQRKNITYNITNKNYIIKVQAIDSSLQRGEFTTYTFNSTLCDIEQFEVIDISCNIENKNLFINGGRTINNGTLRIVNSTITFNLSSGNTGFDVLTNANLHIINSNISAISSHPRISSQGKLYIDNLINPNLNFIDSYTNITIKNSIINFTSSSGTIIRNYLYIVNSSVTDIYKIQNLYNSYVINSTLTFQSPVLRDIDIKNKNSIFENFNPTGISNNYTVYNIQDLIFVYKDSQENYPLVNVSTIIDYNHLSSYLIINQTNYELIVNFTNKTSTYIEQPNFISSKYGYRNKNNNYDEVNEWILNVEMMNLHLPIYSRYDNQITTNFTQVALNSSLNISNVQNSIIHLENIATIKFLQAINFADKNVNTGINITKSLITLGNDFRKSATITYFESFEYDPIIETHSNSELADPGDFYGGSAQGITMARGVDNITFNIPSGVEYITINPNAKIDVTIPPCLTSNDYFNVRVEYKNYSSTEIISSSFCQIDDFDGILSSHHITFNESYHIFNLRITDTGFLNFSIICNKTGFETINKNITVYVRDNSNTVRFWPRELKGLKKSSAIFFDKNNDGYEELFITGINSSEITESLYFEGSQSGLTQKPHTYMSVNNGALAFTNKDSNNYGDLIISGTDGAYNLKDYENKFTYQVEANSIDLALFDLNYKLDMFLMSSQISKLIYDDGEKIQHNTGTVESASTFIRLSKNVIGVVETFKINASSNKKTTLTYSNNIVSYHLINVSKASLVTGDIDKDGDDDLIITGQNNLNHPEIAVYINENASLIKSDSWSGNLNAVYSGSLSLFDYDLDGDLDLAIQGYNKSNLILKIYENNQNSFNLFFEDNGYRYGNIFASDYDNDGDIDFINTGENSDTDPFTFIYENDIAECRAESLVKPSVPELEQPVYQDGAINIKWNTGNNEHYIHYNLKITDAKFNNILSPILTRTTNPSKTSFGNVGPYENASFQIDDQCMLISVQAIDLNYQKSNFSIVKQYNNGGTEICGDDYDNDCDGYVNEGCNVETTASSGNTRPSSFYPQTPPENVDEKQEQPEIPEITEPVVEETQQPTEEKSTITKSEKNLIWNIYERNIKHYREYYFDNGQTHIIETFKNNNIFPLNFSYQLNISKEITPKASLIKSLIPFIIIEEDPIIEVDENINPFQTKTFEYIIKNENEPKDIQLILNFNKTTTKFEEQLEKTKQVLNINKTITRDTKTNTTTYKIDLDFKNESVLYNVTVYQEIPKCLIAFIKQEDIDSKIEFEIVNEDPLIAWHFDKIVNGEKLEFAIKALADSDCDDEGETIAVATTMLILKNDINYKKILITLITIILSLTILGFFTHLHSSPKEKQLERLITQAKHLYRQKHNKDQVLQALINQGVNPELAAQATHLNAKNYLHHLLLKLEFGVQEIIIIILISLNFLEAFHLLSGDLSFIKAIISWTILTFVLYDVSISKILFGIKRKWLDITLLATYFVMTVKNLTALALSSIIEADFFLDTYTAILKYNDIFELYSFIIGMVTLIILTIIISFLKTEKPSVVSIFSKNKYFKPVIIYITLVSFFVIVYNLMFEWLAIAIDSLLGVTLVVAYIYIAIKHHSKFKFSTSLHKVGSMAESFYEKIIESFQYKKTFPIAISGMLILHTISELGIYVVPYVTGLTTHLYSAGVERHALFNILNAHPELPSLFALQTLGATILTKIGAVIIFSLNTVFLLYLFGLPIYLWANMFNNRKEPKALLEPVSLNRFHIFAFTASLITFLLNPSFIFTTFKSNDYATLDYSKVFSGMDILTQRIATDHIHTFGVLAASLIIASIIYLLAINRNAKLMVKNMIFLSSIIFLGYYLINFFIQNLKLFTSTVTSSFGITQIFFSTIILINVLFYTGGIITLYVELWIRREFPFEFIKLRIMEHMATDMHHVHYYNTHDEHHHGETLEFLADYLIKNLKQNHTMFRIAEFLKEHGWPEEYIMEAEKFVHNNHPELNKHKLLIHKGHDKLMPWLQAKLESDTTLELIIEEAQAKGWSEDDIMLILQKLGIHKEVLEI